MYVCVCNQVTDKQIRTAVQNGVTSLGVVCDMLKVAECCGQCKDYAKEVFDEAIHRVEISQYAA